MKVGTEDRKKLAILGVAGAGALAAAVYIYGQLFPSTPTASPAPAVAAQPAPAAAPPASSGADTSSPAVPAAARKIATTSASLDPTLHMSAMLTTESLQYRGSGRNIFSANAAAAPVHIPKPISSARPTLAPTVYTPPQPSGPPPISLTFFGTATRPGQPPRALLLRGDDVVLASTGDIVQRRYKILNISSNSITVEDLADANQQTLPLHTN